MTIRLFASVALGALLDRLHHCRGRPRCPPPLRESPPFPQATGVFAQAEQPAVPRARLHQDQGRRPAARDRAGRSRSPAPRSPRSPTIRRRRRSTTRWWRWSAPGQMLDRANAVLGQLTSANTNDTLDAAQTALAPQLTAHERRHLPQRQALPAGQGGLRQPRGDEPDGRRRDAARQRLRRLRPRRRAADRRRRRRSSSR